VEISPYHSEVKSYRALAALVIFATLLCLSRTGAAFAIPHPLYSLYLQPDAYQQQHQDTSPRLSTFTGTITRNGDQFVLNDATTHALYQLDDQETAGKFRDKKVKVTGTLDVAQNLIRIQSIAEAAA
jgi:hypothetical protein